MKTKLVWITPDADKQIAYMARVSNPTAREDAPAKKLIEYLIDHKHWSPFEMACMCVEINTTRDIARQILRHRSFHFQEFSQRYSKVAEEPIFREARLQDAKNRQNSIEINDKKLQKGWLSDQDYIWGVAYTLYQQALEKGIAKEVARSLLPEGLTPTKMYMQGTIRDWLHYVIIRRGPETQQEHRKVAQQCSLILRENCPDIWGAFFKDV